MISINKSQPKEGQTVLALGTLKNQNNNDIEYNAYGIGKWKNGYVEMLFDNGYISWIVDVIEWQSFVSEVKKTLDT